VRLMIGMYSKLLRHTIIRLIRFGGNMSVGV